MTNHACVSSFTQRDVIAKIVICGLRNVGKLACHSTVLSPTVTQMINIRLGK
jgi:hypothetical protein